RARTDLKTHRLRRLSQGQHGVHPPKKGSPVRSPAPVIQQFMTPRPHRSVPAHSTHRHVAPIHRGPQAMSQTALASPHHAPNACLLIDFDNVTLGIPSDLQTDIRLAIDAMELGFTRPEIGTFILLSGDSDFSSLVIKLKEYGKYVIGVGIRESSSHLLVQNCDEYYSYTALAGLVKTGEEEIVKRDPWELVTEAITRMKRNGDVMRADRLKQVMQQIDSSFDEKNLGMSKFSRFVTE